MSSGLGELSAQANQLIAAGDLAAAQDLLDNALSAADPSPARATTELADAAALHARVLIALGEPHTARGWAAFAYSACSRLHGPSDPRTVAAAATLAAILHRVGSHARAGRLYREVIIELTATDGPESLRVLAAHADLATVEYARGECQVARDRLQDAWELHREVYGDGHVAGVKMLARLGAMQRDCGLHTEGYENLALARELCRQHLSPDHPLAAQIAALADAPPDPRHVCGTATSTSGAAAGESAAGGSAVGGAAIGGAAVAGAMPDGVSPQDEDADHGNGGPWWSPHPSVPPEVAEFVSPTVDPTTSPTVDPTVAAANPATDPVTGDAAGPPTAVPPPDGPWDDGEDRYDGKDRYDGEDRYHGEDRYDGEGWYLAEAAQSPGGEQRSSGGEGWPPPSGEQPHPAGDGGGGHGGNPDGVWRVAALPALREPARLPVHVPRPPRQPDRRLAPAVFAGLLAVLLGAIIVVAGFALVTDPDDGPTDGTGAPASASPDGPAGSPDPAGTPTASPAPGQAQPGTPPGRLELHDGRDRVTLSWSYPSGAQGPVVVSGGRTRQELRAFHELPAGATSYIVYSLNPSLNYCFSVAVVYSADTVGRADPVCTSRSG